ncbi:uncharacterized protein [Amphiura filiformis]|uniref:uncharacterized protein isoform X2 n=1 Tax=Amphiura filiformis TaxID=82378 RepID=UPI003B2141D7
MAAGLSHKDTILIWNDAVLTADKGPQHYEAALQTLLQIENPAAKILFNIGHINLATGHLAGAVQALKSCTEKDPHMAIGHFQLGLCYYRQGKYADSKAAYEKAIKCLRGNKFIDYKQLGMVYKLYDCEVKHNMALSYSKMLTTPDIAIQVLEVALQGKVEAKHNAIGTAITKLQQGNTFDPFTVPSSTMFRPPPSKVANLKNIDYLGKAKVVSELTVPETANAGRRSPSPLPPSKPLPVPANVFRPISPITASPRLSPSSNPSSPLDSTSPAAGLVKLKDNLVMWNEGIMEYDQKNYTEALDRFLKIAEPSAKILFNMASLQVRLGQTDAATNTLQSAIAKDQHLAIAHCLLGNLYCKVNRADDAWRQYEKCLECFRSNKSIDYKQLGMTYKLYQCEVLYNQAFTYAKLGEVDWCTKLLGDAQKCKLEEKHSFIDTAYDNYRQGTLFNILDLPVNLVFRPPKDKVTNLKKQDYLGKQKVVSELKLDKKPPTPPPPQFNNNIHDGELYLPMAPGPLKKENTYAPPVRPPKPQSSRPNIPSAPPPVRSPDIPTAPPPVRSTDIPSAPPVRSSSLTGHNSVDRSPSPLPPGRPPPQVPVLQRQDSFDSDPDEDRFEDEYKSKPVPLPVPLARRFSASNPLPPAPAESPAGSPDIPRRPPPGRPSPIPTSSPSRGSPVPPGRSVPNPIRQASFDRPVPQPPRQINTPPSTPPPQRPSQAIADEGRVRKISLGPPSKPVPSSPRRSPVPSESPRNSPARERKISSGPPPKPVPPSPHRKSPGLPERKPPAPPPPTSISTPPAAPPLPPQGREVPLPPSKALPKPMPPSRSMPLRPARPLVTNGSKSTSIG